MSEAAQKKAQQLIDENAVSMYTKICLNGSNM